MNKPAWLISLALIAGGSAWYAVSPEGPLGYDEGTRLVAHTSAFARALERSGEPTGTLVYVPKYGNEQEISVEFTPGGICAGLGCPATVVSVHVGKGRSGAGYGLNRSVVVPRRLSVSRTQGPIQLELAQENGVVQLIGIR